MIAPLVFSFWFRRSGVARTGRAWSQRAEQRKARSLGRWARRDGSTSSQKACSEKSGRSAGSSSMIKISDTGVPLPWVLRNGPCLSASISVSVSTSLTMSESISISSSLALSISICIFVYIWHNHSKTRTCTHTNTHAHTHTHTQPHTGIGC
jgi:hypothetical protein